MPRRPTPRRSWYRGTTGRREVSPLVPESGRDHSVAWISPVQRGDEAPMIEVRDVTKRYADKTAVDRLSFVAKPGEVTGFLGPNGAGKSTTMRMIVGLDRPTSGSALVNGRRYAEHSAPLH